MKSVRKRSTLSLGVLMAVVISLVVCLVGAGVASAHSKQAVASKTKVKKGPRGKRGPKGATGATGAAGAKGATGATGSQGKEGPRGPEGQRGPEGKPSGDLFAIVTSGSSPGFNGEHPGFTSVSQPTTGVYCLAVEAGVSYYDPIASVEWAHSSGDDLLVEPLGEEIEFTCGPGELEVRTFTIEGGVALSNNVDFVVLLPQK